MLANFEMTMSLPDLSTRTYAKIMHDSALDLASQLAYYFFLALFPALLCMLAIASFFPLQNFTDQVVQTLSPFAMVAVGIGLIYCFAPDAEQSQVWVTPGSLVATTLWLIGSLAFRFYAVNVGNYEAPYGAIGGVILLMLWFYLCALVIVIGAKMNAEIEHASPSGKLPYLMLLLRWRSRTTA